MFRWHEGLLRFARNDCMSTDEKKPAEAGFKAKNQLCVQVI
jgi:hypothetical protein